MIVRVLEIFAWGIGIVSFIALLHTYILYPLTLVIIALIKGWKKTTRSSEVQEENYIPSVTIVCSAYNEEEVIQKKIENFFSLDYPSDKLFLCIGSDGSSDRTNDILRGYNNNPRITVRMLDRGGKAQTINRMMSNVHTDLVVFTDANTRYTSDTIKKLARHFTNPQIGGVCGNLRLIPSKSALGTIGEEKYWTFETWLKKIEGTIESTLGATGAVYAIRRELFEEQPTDGMIADDLLLPLRITAAGYRVVFDEEASAYEDAPIQMSREFHRKIRVAMTTFNAMPKIRLLLGKFSPFVLYALFSHKYLRWFAPFFLIGLFIANILLVLLNGNFLWAFYAQIIFYVTVCVGWISEMKKLRLGIFLLPFYFIAMNAALLVAWLKLPKQGKSVLWIPSR